MRLRNERFISVVRCAGVHWNWYVLDAYNSVVEKGWETSKREAVNISARRKAEITREELRKIAAIDRDRSSGPQGVPAVRGSAWRRQRMELSEARA